MERVCKGQLFLLLLNRDYLSACGTPGAISQRNTKPDPLKSTKSVEELKVGDLERRYRRSRGSANVKERKPGLLGPK